jgi:ribonuclease Z
MEQNYSYNNNCESYVKLKIGGQFYTVFGYSRAGLRTCLMIKEFNVMFDMGYSNDKAFSFDNKLISHGHMDHMGCLHFDHSARRLFNIDKMKQYIMPAQCIEPFKIIASAFSTMNSGRAQFKMIDKLIDTHIIEAEQCFSYVPLLFAPEYVFKAFEMDHGVKSFGYIIYRKSKGLKSEYIGISQQEIIQKKKEIGIENMMEYRFTPLVGYTGDTTIQGVLLYQEFLDVPLLIMECTGFSPDDIQHTKEGKHIHINDIITNKDQFNNTKIMLFHFSQQYKTNDDLVSYIQDIPVDLESKLIYFL